MRIEHEKLIAMRDRRNEAQAERERYTLEQFPIDNEDKTLWVLY